MSLRGSIMQLTIDTFDVSYIDLQLCGVLNDIGEVAQGVPS